jgi:hypothetical protein
MLLAYGIIVTLVEKFFSTYTLLIAFVHCFQRKVLPLTVFDSNVYVIRIVNN